MRLQRLQGFLPLNPQGFGAVSPDSSLNTATSFVTNTNWQGYGGETTMSYLTQMLGMTVQNFASAATGMAVLIAFIRGLVRHSASTIGNFWVDLTRSVLYILLPLALVLALILGRTGRGSELFALRRLPTWFSLPWTQEAPRSPSRFWPLGRRLRRSPSSSWVPMAVVSSMLTPPTRLKTPHRWPTSWRCCPSC